LNLLTYTAKEICETWGYLPVMPSLFVQCLKESDPDIETVRENLNVTMLTFIEHHIQEAELPTRWWYGGPVIKADKKISKKDREAYEMGLECVGVASLLAEAEVLSIAIELLKALNVRDFRLTLGNAKFLEGLTAANVKGARRKASILRGDEDMINQAKHFSSNPVCEKALDDLKILSRHVREFGYKEPFHYDLGSFLDSRVYTSVFFRIGSDTHLKNVITGGRRQAGPYETVGFSFDLQVLLEMMNQAGAPLPPPKVDFLIVNRKKTRKSIFEIMRVLREHGYSVALDYSDLNKDDLLAYARKAGILNLLIVGDEDAAINEVRLFDVTDKVSTKLSVSDIFDEKSGLNKMLKYHKRLELEP